MWLGEQWVYFGNDKYEDRGTYASGKVNVREKNRDGETVYSSFFCQFVGNAYNKIKENTDIKSFKLKCGKISNAPYTDKQGNKKFPKTFTMTIIDVDEIEYRTSPF